MKRWFQGFTKNRSILILYILVLVPIVMMSYFLFYENSHDRKAEEIRKNEQMAIVLSQKLDNYISNTKATLLSLATLEVTKTSNREKLDKVFENLSLAQKDISLYWITDNRGKIIAKYPDSIPDKSAAGKEFFEKAMDGQTYVSDRITGEMTKEELFLIAVPYRDNSNRIVGVLGASIPLKQLQKQLDLKIGSTGFPILVTRSGNFLAHPKLSEVRAKVQDGDPVWQALRAGNSGTKEIVAPLDGKNKLFSWQSMHEADWILVVIQPMDQFQAQIKNLFTRNAIIIMMISVIVILAAYYLVLLRNREEEQRIQRSEKLALVGQLAAGMAHEIRNPLTTIKGFIQLISASTDKKAPTEYLDTILKEVERIQAIISETLVLAKPTPTNFVPVDINQILNEVYTLMEPQTLLHDIKINLSCPPNLPLLQAEPNHLKQVFTNLLKNAIEAMYDSGGEVKIEVGLQKENIKILVSDTGCGISGKIIDKLGSPFVTTKEDGTGLGLMVTYRIIQNHGGTIKVTSNPGTGSTFEVTLPTKQNDD